MNPYDLGGVARIKTLVNNLRSQNPNTVLLDGGDWSEGSAYYFVDAGTNILKAFDLIGYDAVVVGNHDFLTGFPELVNAVERANTGFAVLGANKDLSDPSLNPVRDRIASNIPEYTIRTLPNGVRVAVIGLLCTEFLYYDYVKPVKITNAREKATQLAQKIKKENLADITVILSHNSIHTNTQWAEQIPDIHVVVSGHLHAKTPEPIVVTNAGQPVYVVEAGKWGQFLGELKLSFTPKTKQVELKSYKLHPVSSQIAEDSEMKLFVESQEYELKQRFGRDIFHDTWTFSEEEFYYVTKRESALGNLAAEAYRAAIQSDVGFETSTLIGQGAPQGTLSTWDVINLAPHVYSPIAGLPFPQNGKTWTVKKLTVSGTELMLLLNIPFIMADVADQGGINVAGAKFTYQDKGVSMNPVQSASVYNRNTGFYELVDSSRAYTVAMHDALVLALRVLKSIKPNDPRLLVDLSDLEDSGIETWKAILDYTKLNGGIKSAHLKPGYRYVTLEANVGIYEDDIKISPSSPGTTGYTVEIGLRNEGLKTLPSGVKLKISRSKNANDMKYFGIEHEKLVVITDNLAVPALAPGQSTKIQYLWNNPPATGIYNLHFEVFGKNLDKEANPYNNKESRHFFVP